MRSAGGSYLCRKNYDLRISDSQLRGHISDLEVSTSVLKETLISCGPRAAVSEIKLRISSCEWLNCHAD